MYKENYVKREKNVILVAL